MKYFLLALMLSVLSCSKDKDSSNKCYKCEAISQGRTYNEKVCTGGDPYEKLPKQDAGGNLGWNCIEQ